MRPRLLGFTSSSAMNSAQVNSLRCGYGAWARRPFPWTGTSSGSSLFIASELCNFFAAALGVFR